MLLTEQSWPAAESRSHGIIQVDCDPSDIERARYYADLKLATVNPHGPGGLLRNKQVVRNRLTAGKLADAAVGAWLQQACAMHPALPSGTVLLEYDRVRTDEFQYPDPYDLALLTPEGVLRSMEVRASFSYRVGRPSTIARKLSLYGWYSTHNKAMEPEKDGYWQAFFYARPEDLPAPEGFAQIPVFEDCLNQGKVTLYLVAGASRALLERIGQTRKDQDQAEYWAIYPAERAWDIPEMTRRLLQSLHVRKAA